MRTLRYAYDRFDASTMNTQPRPKGISKNPMTTRRVARRCTEIGTRVLAAKHDVAMTGAIQEKCAATLRGGGSCIGGFQQPWTKDSANVDGTANHSIGKLVEFNLRTFRVLRGEPLSTNA